MTHLEEIIRSETELVVLDDAPAWREFHERVLRRAGFGLVNSYPAQPSLLFDHLNNARGRKADLVVFGVQPNSEFSWENLRLIRGFFQGPVLATMERMDADARARILDLGVHDFVSVGDCGEEGLELKVETAITAYRINTLIDENDQRTQRIFLNIMTVMVKILENKDPYTRFHSHSVAIWSRMIGRRRGLTEEDLIRLGLAAVFHDFGKIGIPEEILNKPSRLTDEEFAIMKQHPTIARDLLSSLDLMHDLLPAITHHHERWDGRGYPAGLKSDQIPLWGRIICIADAYDTMASRRTYKEPMPPERVLEELHKGRGTQFDPELVDILVQILAEKAAESAEKEKNGNGNGNGNHHALSDGNGNQPAPNPHLA
ncbi:MAG: HD-GYP domain-containing protein [Planctomycetota bacterium]|nr:HD-GYP domain-containing protein [Planctomycetota bacterium]